MLLKDKVVLVTGSTTGIGEAIARKCVAEGASVMVHGRREHAAQGLCVELGDAAAYTVGDVADPELCESLVANTVNRFGRIDGVANNAATTARATIEQTDAATFDRHYHINLRAPALIIRAALPHFRAQGEGTVVNIGSVNAWSGQADLMPYSASKGGLQTMTRNMANALAEDRIRINQLNVGWCTSPNEIALKISEGLPEDWYLNVPRAFAPTGRLLTPDQVAHHVAFWLSPDSQPANGCVYELEQFCILGRSSARDWDD